MSLRHSNVIYVKIPLHSNAESTQHNKALSSLIVFNTFTPQQLSSLCVGIFPLCVTVQYVNLNLVHY